MESCCRGGCWRPVSVVGVSFVLTESFCCCCHRLLIVFVGVSLLALASCSHGCIFHSNGGVPPYGCFLRICSLFVVVFVSVLLSALAMCCSRLRQIHFSCLILSSSACHHHRCFVVVGIGVPSCGYFCRLLRLVVVVVVVGSSIFGGVSLLPSLSDSRCCQQRRLVVVFVGSVALFSEKLSLY